MWGPMYMVGQGLSAMSFAIVVLIMLSQVAPLDRVITSAHLHDLGKLLFAFLMLWAYLTFSQFLIIWSANLAEEIPHYLIRWDNGYQWVSVFMIVAHFALPYVLLLSRDIKRDWKRLRMVATWVLDRPNRRVLLARRAGVSHRWLERRALGFRGADCDRRHLSGVVCGEPEGPFAAASQ